MSTFSRHAHAASRAEITMAEQTRSYRLLAIAALQSSHYSLSPMEFIPNPDIVSTPLDDNESVLLNLRTREYYSMNETGSVIWSAIQRGESFDHTVAEVTDRFDIDAEGARKHVHTFLDHLVAIGIIVTK